MQAFVENPLYISNNKLKEQITCTAPSLFS